MPKKDDNEKTPAMHKTAGDEDRAEVQRPFAKGADGNEPKADEAQPLFLRKALDILSWMYATICNLGGKTMSKKDDNDKTPPLHEAAAEGDCAEIKRLVAEGEDVNEPDEDGWTPLHFSVAEDHPATIGTLADGGADINRQDNDGKAPLHLAAWAERPAIARTLIDRGADVNLGDNNKATPLHLAAQRDSWVVAGILIDNRAKLYLADENGDTPLHDAAGQGSLRVAKSLIDALIEARTGAKVGKENNGGLTPLYIAQLQGHNEVADLLIDASGLDGLVVPKPETVSVAEQVYDGVWPSIVRISVGVHERIVGSGVIIAPGFVATNCHVIDIAERIIVQAAEDRRISEYPKYSAALHDNNSKQDLCLLEVEDLGAPENRIKIRKYDSLRVGEDVYAVGNPTGDVVWDLSLSAGIISQLRDDGNGERRIQTDAAISGGSSGGGLFDRDGNLVGITTESDVGGNDPQNLNFAIPADWLLGMLPNKAT